MARNQFKKHALLSVFLWALSCKNAATPTSQVQSDWETEAEADKARSFVIDWSCEPKQFGAASEKTVAYQEEYCEWRKERETATEKVCRFTTSFDESRDFHLNSRKRTPFNTIPAAKFLVDSCAEDALSRLDKGLGAGKLCGGLDDACVAGRNSDPEICERVRWAAKERFDKKIDFCVDQLPKGNEKTETPFMQFGLLADIPENCQYTTDDQTEMECTIPKSDDCFSVAGQIRVGLRVFVKEAASKAELPLANSCYQADLPFPSFDEDEPREERVVDERMEENDKSSPTRNSVKPDDAEKVRGNNRDTKADASRETRAAI